MAPPTGMAGMITTITITTTTMIIMGMAMRRPGKHRRLPPAVAAAARPRLR